MTTKLSKFGREPKEENPYAKENSPLDLLKVDKEVVAVCIADVHLSHKPPIARSVEPNWYAAMRRPLEQVQALLTQYKVPCILAGDLFHKSCPPLELVNWAMRAMPRRPDTFGISYYAIAGNHDLPFHRYGDMHKSAYYTLCLHGVLWNLEPGGSYLTHNLVLWGFPCGTPVTPCPFPKKDFALQVAVVHDFVWINGCGYEGAPEQARVKHWHKRLKGYEVAVFGDNHMGFVSSVAGKPSILNCGALIRRTAPEENYQPTVGLLCADGTIIRTPLNCSEDKFLPMDGKVEVDGKELDLSSFIEELQELGDEAPDFNEAVKRRLQTGDVPKPVKRFVLEAMGERDK